MNLLILEDEDVIRRLLSRVMARIGGTIFTASSVREAVAIVDKTPLDLLITDIKLADGEGYDVIRHLNRRRPGAKSVIVTGLIPSAASLQEMALKDIADIVAKPFTINEMEVRMRKIIPAGKVERE